MTPDVTASNLYQILSTSITDSASRKSSTSLIMFSVDTIVGSVIFGYLGECIIAFSVILLMLVVISDKIKHRRPLLMFSVFWLVLSTVLFMFGNVFQMLQLARLIQGLSNLCIWIMGMCLIVDMFPTNKVGKQVNPNCSLLSILLICQAGIIVAAHSFGFLIGPPVGTDKYNFVGECLNPGRLDEMNELTFSTVDSERSIYDNQEQSVETEKGRRMTYLKLFQHNRLLNTTLMALLQGFVIAGLDNSLTIRLASEWKYTSGQIGLIFIARVIPTFISAPFAVMTPVQFEIACIVRFHNEGGEGDDSMGRSYGLFNIAYAVGGIIGPLTSGYLCHWILLALYHHGLHVSFTCSIRVILIGGRRVNVS
ncbi:hypothetical protein AB4K20DRAFT_1870412 [Rhizopus microsporus]